MLPDGKPLALLPVDNLQTEANEGRPELVVEELANLLLELVQELDVF